VKPSAVVIKPYVVPCTCPEWQMREMKHLVQRELTGKLKYSDKTCFSAALSTTNPTWTDLGLNPGSYSYKPATDWLNYKMAKCINILSCKKFYIIEVRIHTIIIFEKKFTQDQQKTKMYLLQSPLIYTLPSLWETKFHTHTKHFNFETYHQIFYNHVSLKIVQSFKVPRLIFGLKRWEHMESICLFSSLIGSELS
jgi:hypothetical protein